MPQPSFSKMILNVVQLQVSALISSSLLLMTPFTHTLAILSPHLRAPPIALGMVKPLRLSSLKNSSIITSTTNFPLECATPFLLSDLDTFILPLKNSLTFSQGAHLLNHNHTLPFNSNLLSPSLSLLLQPSCCARQVTVSCLALCSHLLLRSPSPFLHAGHLSFLCILLGAL